MDRTTLLVSASLPNTLTDPRPIRDYVNERAEGRSFNLDSFGVLKTIEPQQVVIEFLIAQKGAEQLDPFRITLALREPATNQV